MAKAVKQIPSSFNESFLKDLMIHINHLEGIPEEELETWEKKNCIMVGTFKTSLNPYIR